MTLATDISRCQGIAPDGQGCELRHKCERYLALMDAPTFAARFSEARFLCLTADGRVDPDYPHFLPDRNAE